MRRLAEARHRQSVLLARLRAAEIRVELERCVNLSGAGARFDQLERRLVEREDALLAQVEASHPDDDLEAELRNIEQEKRIEEELEILKKEAGTSPRADAPI
jgi:phage shock protein A